ncbi:MAG: DUF4019 domain-containing protein [Burkholderiaceae bacterium]
MLALTGCDVKFDIGEMRNGTFRKLDEPGFAERDTAIKVSAEFLKMMDDNRISDTWPFLGDKLRNQISQSAWETAIHSIRSKVGNYRNRTLIGAAFAKEIEGAPSGHYYLIDYASEFENGTIHERAVLNLEESKWRIEGYFASKDFIGKRSSNGSSP